MRSKKFRSQQFYVGDLVSPNWKPKIPTGLGIVLNIKTNQWHEKSIVVCWQLTGVTEEAIIDLNLVEQVLD